LWHIRIPRQRNNENNRVPITMKRSPQGNNPNTERWLWIRCDGEQSFEVNKWVGLGNAKW
jgi:hypothetical protein